MNMSTAEYCGLSNHYVQYTSHGERILKTVRQLPQLAGDSMSLPDRHRPQELEISCGGFVVWEAILPLSAPVITSITRRILRPSCTLGM